MNPRPESAPSRRPAPVAVVLATAALAAVAAFHAPAAQAAPYGYGTVATAGGVSHGGDYHRDAAAEVSTRNVLGQSSAFLNTGSVHAFAWSSNDPVLSRYCQPWMLWCNWGIGAAAYYWDTIYIKAGRDDRISGELVELFWDTDGETTRGKWWTKSVGYSRFYAGYDPLGYRSVALADVSKNDLHVNRSIAVPAAGETTTLYIFGEIRAYAEGGGVADFSHSGHFNWSIPEGLEWTSASGQLIAPTVRPAAPAPNPVDEPAPIALAGLGLAAVGFARRRRVTPRVPGRGANEAAA